MTTGVPARLMMIASPLATLTRRFTRRHPGVTLVAEAAFTPDEVVGKVRRSARAVHG